MPAPDPKKDISGNNGKNGSYPLDRYTNALKNEGEGGNGNSHYFKSAAPSVSLPKGGGALKGIDEKFTVNAVNGTSSLQIPLPFTAGRGGFTPSLSLQYNSGSGNSDYGLGWSLTLPSIQRKTDKKLPQYNDANESDIFVMGGAEDLIPELSTSGAVVAVTGTSPYTVKRYRPRIEGLFARIERITKTGQNDIWWKVTTKDNIVTFYGLTSEARVSDPENGDRIFRWLPQLSYDNKGNVQRYRYSTDNTTGIVPSALHEQNRKNGLAPFTNTYIKTVSWCNVTPFTVTSDYEPSLSADPDYKMIAAFDYGNFNVVPGLSDSNAIPVRVDPYSDFHAGFEIRTYRKCNRVLMFHLFSEIFSGITSPPSECLVRSLDFTYKLAGTNALAEADYITSIVQKGYKLKSDGSYASSSFPALTIAYTPLTWNNIIQTVTEKNIENAPQGLTGSYQWIDLWGEGLPGILTEQAQAWYYKTNLGDGNFTPALTIAEKPSFSGLGEGMQWMDLDANGKRQLVSRSQTAPGYFELDDDQQWQPFRDFKDWVNVDWNSPYTRVLDLNGDGRPDLLLTEETVWKWYENEGTHGYTEGGFGASYMDEEKGPRLLHNDMMQTVFLADMNGDGMTDIVRIQNGEVCYWPNIGYGRFGAKVAMSNAPYFDKPDTFNPKYLILSDISGTGAADIIYIGRGKCTAYINLAGNGWGNAVDICQLPAVELFSKITVADFLGIGTSCIVWSSPLPQHAWAPMRYIDLMGGKKPYLMTSYTNGMGKTVSLDYKQSTKYYLEDKYSSKPWATKLPFPVHCVREIITTDTVSNTSYKQQYSYHHGYYDHDEREFRGFGRVEIIDTDIAYALDTALTSDATSSGDLNQYPVKTVSWYHTGAWMRHGSLVNTFSTREYYNTTWASLPDLPDLPSGLTPQEQREAYRALKGQPLRQEVYALDGISNAPYTVNAFAYAIKMVQPVAAGNRFASFHTHQQHSLIFSCERNISDPRVMHELTLETDEYGNVLKSAKVCYPRTSIPSGTPSVVGTVQQKMLCTYTENNFTNDIFSNAVYRPRVLYETKTFEITGLSLSGSLWTCHNLYNQINGNTSLSISAATEINFTASPSSSTTPPVEKRTINASRTLYAGNNTTTVLSLGIIESLAIPYQKYHLVISADMLTNSAWYNNLVTGTSAMLVTEGGLLQESAISAFGSSVTTKYWLPGGTITYDTAHFFTPTVYTDPWGKTTTIAYWDAGGINYYLLPESVTDALSNVTIVNTYNWYNLQPTSITDPNNNISEILFDALGMPAAMAVKGKGTEADALGSLDPHSSTDISTQASFWTTPASNAATLLGSATWRCVYDLSASPVRVAMIGREIHDADVVSANPLIMRFTYTDGFGRVAMNKVQAAPAEPTPSTARWIGSGKTVYNNKGKPVMQYEPYFSSTHACDLAEAAAAVGVTPRIHYDALGRVVRTDMPDGSFTSTVWDSWKQTVSDNNDNVSGSDWEALRSGSGALASDSDETDALDKAKKHKQTPTIIHLDTLARPFYTKQHNKYPDSGGTWQNYYYESYVVLDIEGTRLAVVDARGITVLTYTYNMLKAPVRQVSVDSGTQVMLTDAANQPLYAWDAMGNRFKHTYDDLRRPLSKEVLTSSSVTKVLEVKVYGEGATSAATHNLKGMLWKNYDGAGKEEITDYDFTGQPLSTIRTFVADPTIRPDWTTTNIASSAYLESESYITDIEYDALDRPVNITTPEGGVTSYTYDKSGQLFSVDVSGVNSLTTDIINEIYYNAKGQRIKVKFENGTITTYFYDSKTFRVRGIYTIRNSDSKVLQELMYVYDPVGNITLQRDGAQQNAYFSGSVAVPENNYTYDALYRLVKAGGREKIGANTASNYTDSDKTGASITAPNSAIQAYVQYYSYDEVGNMGQMKHTAGTSYTNYWTRNFEVEKTTGGTPVPVNNRLHTCSIGSGTTGSETYTYDARGNMTGGMNHLTSMAYNEENRLETVVITGSITAYYQYDSSGQRVRKHIVNTSSHTAKSRKYVGQWELYTEYDTATSVVSLERETLHIMDDQARVAVIDSPITIPSGSGEVQLLRYQYSNHLSTASLELDHTAAIISYEEYYPYGSTSFQSGRSGAEVSLKRYRFVGKEKDEETGLYYIGARYYCPWLARWGAVDIKQNENPEWTPYRYCFDNPIKNIDPDGKKEFESYDAYKQHMSQMQEKDPGHADRYKILSQKEMGSRGDWLKSDREKQTGVWGAANSYNLQQKDGYKEYKTISQRTAFYGWFQRQTEKKGSETKWAGAAYIVAQQMSLMDDPLIASFNSKEVLAFANAGNKAIFEDVFDNLRDLYNGPALKGDAAKNWDKVTLTHEQKDVVQPIYDQQSEKTINDLQKLAQGRGWKAAMGVAFDRRFPVGGPLMFEGKIKNWVDRYNHGMNKAVPFYEKYGSIFNWNKKDDGRMDSVFDPDNKGLPQYGEPKF